MKPWVAAIARWLLAVLITTLIASITQTQFNLAALADLGQPVALGLRLQTTLLDLLRFAPLFAGIVAGGFLLALPLAALLLRRWPAQRWLMPAAGAVAILTALLLMRGLLGLTPIAAARDVFGLLSLALAGACGAGLAQADFRSSKKLK